jgi:hypothetical protein
MPRRCLKHDLAVGPRGHCVLCRTERHRTQKSPARARLPSLLVGLVACLVGPWVLGTGYAAATAWFHGPHRVGLALDAVYDARQRFKVDEQRVYTQHSSNPDPLRLRPVRTISTSGR